MTIGDYIPLVSVIIIGIEVLVILKQIADQHKWYRRDKALSYSNIYHPKVQETKFVLEEAFNLVTRCDAIPIEEIKQKIEKDKSIKLHLNYILTYYENIGIACFNGIADEDILYDMMRNTLISYNKKLFNYMDYRRKEAGNPRLWEHFDGISNRWESRRSSICGKPQLGTIKNIINFKKIIRKF